MKISELFRQLSFGELSNLAISNSGSGTIIEAKHPQLIQYVNTALTALHTRFVLSQKEIILELVDEYTRYELSSRYAQSAAQDVDYRYINDTPEDPFKDDLLRVLEVWGPFGQLPLNDPKREDSLFTPSALVLQVPYPIGQLPLSIIYQADHVQLSDTGSTLLDQEVNLPHYLHNAFRKRIGAEVFSHLNGQENILKNQEYLAAYEADCLAIEQSDLANQSSYSSHSKLEDRGFV